MLVADFLRERPCLEEVDGYLKMVRHAAEHPDELGRHYDEINADVLVPLAQYRQKLMQGKIVPAETRLQRAWIYKMGSAPRAKPEVAAPAEPEKKYLVANRRR